MKKVLYFLIISLFLIIPSKVNAKCTSSDLTKIKTFASNITYKYDFTEKIGSDSYGSVKFNIYFYNVTDEMMIKYVPNYVSTGQVVTEGKIDLPKVGGIVKLENAPAGKSSRFEVYATSISVCAWVRLYTFYVATPSYNKFYSSELCKKAGEHKYCQRWSNLNITEKEFKETLEKYLSNEKVITTIEDDIKPTKTLKERLIELVELLNEYVYAITIPLIVVCAILIIILKMVQNKKAKL